MAVDARRKQASSNSIDELVEIEALASVTAEEKAATLGTVVMK